MSGELDELLKKNKISYSSEAATKIKEANRWILIKIILVDQFLPYLFHRHCLYFRFLPDLHHPFLSEFLIFHEWI